LNSDHNKKDLLQASPFIDYGIQGAAHDRAKGSRGGKDVWMPPVFLVAQRRGLLRTLVLIHRLWFAAYGTMVPRSAWGQGLPNQSRPR
jgi:hypothetical protein